MAKRSLVIGYGPIGHRHVRVLKKMGHEIAVVSRRPIEFNPLFAEIPAALTNFDPDYVVIANETSAHRRSLFELRARGCDGPILVEKPLFENTRLDDPPDDSKTFIGYNLRFHPLLVRLRDWLNGRKILAATIHVGQHLARRPSRSDFAKSHAAQRKLGGGVLRELSHELDYTMWLFGPWRRVAALGGNSGALGIDADDRWSIILECMQCPQVEISLSFIDHVPRRHIQINTADDTVHVDFVGFTFTTSAVPMAEHINVERDESYQREHTEILGGAPLAACSYREGYLVVQLIEAIEAAAAQERWIRPK